MYRRKTLSKFNKDKSYKYFPGTAIIHFIDQEEINQFIIKVKKSMEESKLFDKFIFLPEDSYHMTVCDLVTYSNMFEKSTFQDFKFKASNDYEKMDKYIIEKLGKINFDLNIQMVVDKITKKQIRLRPKSIKDSSKLTEFRAKVYETLKIRMKPDYKFHISINYQLYNLDEELESEIDDYLLVLNEEVVKTLPILEVNKATLVAFNDMSTFRDLSLGRKKLGMVEK